MSEEIADAPDKGTADRIPLTLDQAAAKLQELRNPQAEETDEPEPVEDQVDPEPETEVLDEEVDYSAFLESDDIEAEDGDSGPGLTLKRKGEEFQATREEATRYAQMGLDYHLRSNELDDAKREFEAFATNTKESLERELAEARKSREALASRLSKFQTELTPPDPELAESDPDEWTRQNARYQARKAEADLAQVELEKQAQEEQAKIKAQREAALTQHMNRLHSRVPAMKEDKVAQGVGKFLVDGMGFTRDDLVVNQRIHPMDSRFLETAYYAKKYLDAKAKAKKRSEPSKTASTGRAGRAAPKTDTAKELVAKAKKTGSKKDAVEALRAIRSKAS